MAFRISLSGSKSQLGSKARAEEDEKARKEEEARKKVLADMLDEHGDSEDDDGSATKKKDGGVDQNVFVPQGAKRHYAGRMRSTKSGPGTLDQEPKDTFGRPGFQSRFGNQFPPRFGGPVPPVRGPQESSKNAENIYTTVIAMTSNLPPGSNQQTVEELFAAYKSLKVVKVEKLPEAEPDEDGFLEHRPSVSLIVTFDKDADPQDFNAAMRDMNDKKYLGRGYYLHLDRYLGGRVEIPIERRLPFGARWVEDKPKGYAPTAELGGGTGHPPDSNNGMRLVVTAYPPPDLPTLKLIHITIESVIKGGIEFEAALMEDPKVQNDERWAFLYDARHPLSRYYRWKLCQVVTGGKVPKELYKGYGEWEGPAHPFPDEFAYKIEHLDPDADDEAEDEEQLTADPYPGRDDSGNGILPVRSRAFLMFILADLPIGGVATNEQIAAFPTFAIKHATKGMDEIVSIVITNILQPFCLTTNNPKYHPSKDENGIDFRRRKHIKEATLNALRVVNDICFVTHREGGKAWKYRDTIGTELLKRKVFEYIETLPMRLEWGRVDEDGFRKFVNSAIEYWKEEYLFSAETLDHFDKAFNWRKMQKDKEDQERRIAEKRAKVQPQQKRRKEASNTVISIGSKAAESEPVKADVDMADTTDPKERDNASVPQQDPLILEQPAPQALPKGPAAMVASAPSDEIPGETAAARARRLRPKAEDMFASDEE